jgi:alanyl-tRNA synthetase
MGKRIADVQKCVRTGDIDDVGDNRHLTFFEMLGNWSLGDYFKKESIVWSYEFLTDKKWLGIDPEMLAVTVFEGDASTPFDIESKELWMQCGIPENRISPLPAEDNWWAAGPTGPCGPDTEIFYWVGEGKPTATSNLKNDPKNWMEIWNNVFMEFNRGQDGVLAKLPAPCVDTGMGLERVTATLNGKKTVFETDIFEDYLAKIREITGAGYVDHSARIVADHVRAASHMIADGVVPKNVAQGYVLRRLIRRAVREMFKMGIEQPVLSEIAKIVVEKFRNVYVSIRQNEAKIYDELVREEAKFGSTIKDGIKEFEKLLAGFKIAEEKTGKKVTEISGEKAFRLYDTYGFPLEMTVEVAREKGLMVDTAGFKQKFEEHQAKSQTASAGMFKGGLADQSEVTTKFHTATHILLAGLRKVLGDHVYQAGSNITVERLRFDFTHGEKVTPEQLKSLEDFANTIISAPATMTMVEMKKEEARAMGVVGSFWEKYPEIVKVYTLTLPSGEVVSRELCGGPHVESTANMGTFKIQKEEASSAGVRRIKAVLQ